MQWLSQVNKHITLIHQTTEKAFLENSWDVLSKSLNHQRPKPGAGPQSRSPRQVAGTHYITTSQVQCQQEAAVRTLGDNLAPECGTWKSQPLYQKIKEKKSLAINLMTCKISTLKAKFNAEKN